MAGRKRTEITGNGPRADLARRLRRLRDESRLTLRALAAKSGYAAGSLSAAESGRRVPTWDLVEAFVQGCGGNPAQWRQLWEVADATPDPPNEIEQPSTTSVAHAIDPVAGTGREVSTQPSDTQAAGLPPAPTAPAPRIRFPYRYRYRRILIATAAVALLVSAGVALGLNLSSSPRHIGPAAAAAAQAKDDTDPYDDHCKGDDKQLDWQPVTYADGSAYGTLILMFSPSCDAAWGYLSGPNSTQWTQHILTHRDPGEKTLSYDYSGNAPSGSWGNVLSTRDGCVYVEAYITDRHGNGPHAKTACLQPKLPAAP
jgi:transcriptional regulator with XRE-family HTH domain